MTSAAAEVIAEGNRDDLGAITAALAAIAGSLRATSDDDQVSPEHLLQALELLRWAQAELTAIEPVLITAARAAGVSWQSLASALGVASRQAAERRYLRGALTSGVLTSGTRTSSTLTSNARTSSDLTSSTRTSGAGTSSARTTGDGTTRDARVQAERDRRAGHRAVTRWANDNTADLRRLAGQVVALNDLGAAAAEPVDRLHEALGAPDAAALPDLLADAQPHLSRHPELSAQIDAVTERAAQMRRRPARRNPPPV